MIKRRPSSMGASRVIQRSKGTAQVSPPKPMGKDFSIARKRMMEEQLIGRGIKDPRVLALMEKIPRHLFVEEALEAQAYQDRPVNIGEGQTISQPYIVALMDELLALKGTERVLEIGTGCGYQTTLLSHLAKEVFSIERIKPLALKAIRRLKDLGCRNVVVRVGDGTLGWPERAPFDAITVAAASPEIPAPFLTQLKEGGHLIIPTGSGDVQRLLLLEKRNGVFVLIKESPCRFVKLIGHHGW